MLLKLCQFYRVHGKLGQAVPLAETIAAIFPESIQAPKALLLAAYGYRQVGRLDYAQAAVEKVVADYSDSAEVTEALQHLLSIYEGHEGLEAAVTKLWALAAKYPDTRVATATGEIMTQVAGGRYEEAFRLGNEGQYEQAIAQFDKALALQPVSHLSARAQLKVADLLVKGGRICEAANAFRELIGRKPRWASDHATVALVNLAKKHPEIEPPVRRPLGVKSVWDE